MLKWSRRWGQEIRSFNTPFKPVLRIILTNLTLRISTKLSGGGDGVSILDPSWSQASENIQDRSCFLLQASPFGTANTPLLKNSSLRITTCYLKWLWFTVLGLISWNYLKKRNRTLTTYRIKFLVQNNMKHFDVIRIPEETKEELLKQKGHRTWEVFLKEVASKEKLVA